MALMLEVVDKGFLIWIKVIVGRPCGLAYQGAAE